MAGGNSGGAESYLPIAAALAATIATDGAASPWLVDAMGATAAGALTSGAAAAAASGLTAAVTGQDVGRSALMGAGAGALGGALGTTAIGTEGIAGATPTIATAPVSGTLASTDATAFGPGWSSAGFNGGVGAGGAGTAGDVFAGYSATGSAAGTAGSTVGAAGGAGAAGGVGGAGAGGVGGAGAGFWGSNMGTAAKLGLGATALGYFINQDNKKYGTPTDTTYEGPLTDFHYSRENYTPLTTAQPNPAYKPVYPNYVKNPYNAYAAEGGHVVAMAAGGIAGDNQNVDGAGQMFQTNGVAQNQIYPQSTINSDTFSNPTNVPISQNIVSGISDASVDPYTGAERFAGGGTTGGQPNIPLQAMPNFITQNSVNTNNALTQDLVSRMAARNAASPMPGQTPPVAPMQPAGIMAAAPQTQYQGYSTPTFTRPTNVAPVQFQNPGAIVGTKAYNDRIAAEAAAEAERQAAMYTSSSDGSSNIAGATGGLPKDFKHYAAGGGIGHLGSYSDGGRLLKGPGDGMSDNIPAQIGAKQPARLADGEFVVPADVVSHLGNGSTDAGAKKLYAMMDRVRAARTGTKKQGKQIKADKYLKA